MLPALLSAGSASASQGEPRWRISDVWRQPQGLAQDSVLALLQTRDGYLWIGTRGGLSRFDGHRFMNVDDRNREQLRETEVWALAEADDGSLWIGTFAGGVSRLKDGRFTVYTQADGLVDDTVRALAADEAGGVYIGTERGVTHFSNGRFRSYGEAEGLLKSSVVTLYRDTDGSLWISGSGDGLYRLKDGRIESVTLPEPRPVRVEDFLRDGAGALWLATHTGLHRLADGRMWKYTTADGLSSDWMRRLAMDAAGRVLVLTDLGLDRYTGASPPGRAFEHEADTGGAHVMLFDREDGLWLGHIGAGVARAHKALFLNFAEPEGLADSNVYALLEDSAGSVWAGTRTGLHVLRNGTFTAQPYPSMPPGRSITALAETRDGHLWVGSEDGLFRSRQPTSRIGGDGILPLEGVAIEGPERVRVRTILEDSRGTVWVGLNTEGLARVAPDGVRLYTTKDGLSSAAIRALVEDRDGSLWVGSRGGVDRLKDGSIIESHTGGTGLASASVQALHLDADGALWIATRRGLNRLKDGALATVTLADGLYSNHVYGFVEDGHGDLWMSCGKGIFRVALRELHDFAEGKAASITSVAYGRDHGLNSTMGAVGYHPVAVRAKDGRLWFATFGGLASIDPRRLSTNTVPPPVHVERVEIDERAYAVGEEISAPPGKRDLVFHYTALSFLAPEKVAFRYQLEGFDNTWREAGGRRSAFYTNVPPGGYRFRVTAANNDGVWNEEGASVELGLAPYVHETYWFYGLCLGGVALAGAATQRLRVGQLKRKERELSRRVEEALAQVRVLRGLLPVCAWCKQIRDDKGAWSEMEAYIHAHTEADFTHGICPRCAERLQPTAGERGSEVS